MANIPLVIGAAAAVGAAAGAAVKLFSGAPAPRRGIGQNGQPSPTPGGGQQAPGVQPQTVSFDSGLDFTPWWWGWWPSYYQPYYYPQYPHYGERRLVCERVEDDAGREVLECRERAPEAAFPTAYPGVYPVVPLQRFWWY